MKESETIVCTVSHNTQLLTYSTDKFNQLVLWLKQIRYGNMFIFIGQCVNMTIGFGLSTVLWDKIVISVFHAITDSIR